MCKQIWVDVKDELELKLDRPPTEKEIEEAYQDKISQFIDRERDS